MKVCVVGLGTIGLPLAVRLALGGAEVVGVDNNPRRLAEIDSGEAGAGEPGLHQALAEVISKGRLELTDQTSQAVAGAQAVLLIVRLAVDGKGQPDFGAIDAATSDVARGLTRGALVCFETTVPVGTTRARFLPMLEEGSGLRAGVEFDLCFSPERVSSGSIFKDLERYPKVVGGLTPAAGDAAAALYHQHLGSEVMVLSSLEASEFSKVAETTYRDVNIALANEFAVFADQAGIDLSEVISAANSQPFSHIHSPGVGVGGHCIPVYPHFFIATSRQHELATAGRRINDSMPGYAARRLDRMMGGLTGRHVLILGLSYRADVAEASHSVTLELGQALGQLGAEVRVHDPLLGPTGVEATNLTWDDPGSGWAEALVLQAAHSQYRVLTPATAPGVVAVLDGRGGLDPAAWRRAGVAFAGIGR